MKAMTTPSVFRSERGKREGKKDEVSRAKRKKGERMARRTTQDIAGLVLRPVDVRRSQRGEVTDTCGRESSVYEDGEENDGAEVGKDATYRSETHSQCPS